MSKAEAQMEATARAVEKLREMDLAMQCHLLKLPKPENGVLKLRMFGMDCALNLETFELTQDSEKPVKEADRIIFLHYLLCTHPLTPSDELISFRDFPGGAFYLEPFRSRTVNPLAQRYGKSFQGLEKAFERFDFQMLEMGDLSARIHALGCVDITLVCRAGDDEFPVEAEVFFNRPAQHAFCAEDAAVLASRICIGLL